MTMHILPAYYTTTRTRKRKKNQKVNTTHQAWIEKVTGGKKSDKKLLDINWRKQYTDEMKVERSDYVSAGMSGSASSTANRSLMSNLHKEPEHVRKAILEKASRVMPLFNKGGLQYATPETDLTTVGSKSRRG